MLRFMVDYISEEFRFLKMLEGSKPEARTTITFAELDAARADTAKVSIGSGIIRSIADLRRELATQQIVVSDGAGRTPSMCCERMRSYSAEIPSPRTI